MKVGAVFVKVQSESDPKTWYTVRVTPEYEVRCDCPAGAFRGECKHVQHVKFYIKKLAQLLAINYKKSEK